METLKYFRTNCIEQSNEFKVYEYCLKDVFFEQIYFLQYRKATLSQSE